MKIQQDGEPHEQSEREVYTMEEKKECPFRMSNTLENNHCVDSCAWYRISQTTGQPLCAFVENVEAVENIMKAVTASLKIKFKEYKKSGEWPG